MMKNIHSNLRTPCAALPVWQAEYRSSKNEIGFIGNDTSGVGFCERWND